MRACKMINILKKIKLFDENNFYNKNNFVQSDFNLIFNQKMLNFLLALSGTRAYIKLVV